jgi:hypothetical protein
MARPRYTWEQILQLVAYYKQFGTVGDVLDPALGLVHALHGKKVGSPGT